MESASGGSKYEANRADVDWRVVDRHFPMRSRPGSGPDFARSGAVVNGRLVLQKMAGSEVAPPSPPASGTPAWTNLRYLGSTGVGLQRFNHSSVYDPNTDRMIAFLWVTRAIPYSTLRTICWSWPMPMVSAARLNGPSCFRMALPVPRRPASSTRQSTTQRIIG